MPGLDILVGLELALVGFVHPMVAITGASRMVGNSNKSTSIPTAITEPATAIDSPRRLGFVRSFCVWKPPVWTPRSSESHISISPRQPRRVVKFLVPFQSNRRRQQPQSRPHNSVPMNRQQSRRTNTKDSLTSNKLTLRGPSLRTTQQQPKK